MASAPSGYRRSVVTDVEIERALAIVAATLNDQRLERFDPKRVQAIITDSLGAGPNLTVDGGGGLHEESGARVGAIRRASSGEWITERQNHAAVRSHTAIPARPSETVVRTMLKKLKRRR
jgi:hypothetical protein